MFHETFHLLLLVAAWSTVDCLTVSSGTDLGQYTAAMISAGQPCHSVVGSNTFTVTAKSCRSSCNYPDGVCVTEVNTRDIFASATHRCQTVPSACKSAVRSASAGGGGGGPTVRPTAGTTRRTFATRTTTGRPGATTRATRRTFATRATTTTGRPSGGGGGASCSATPAQGRRTNGVRFSRPYYYDAATKRCRQFLYWGVGGNDNRYTTKSACESACSGSSSVPASSNAPHSAADCSLQSRAGAVSRRDPSRCRGSERRYSFLTTRSMSFCTSFTFSNCEGAGNNNNFATKQECEQVCRPSRRG